MRTSSASRTPTFFEAMRERWQEFNEGKPGKRFQQIHQRRGRRQGKTSVWRKWGYIALASVLIFAGLFFLAVPGPGLLILAPGLALLAAESLTVAKFLDWAELKTRPLYLWAKARWKKAGRKTRLLILLAMGACGLAAAALAYFWFVR
jgi:hypothetical protein